MAELYLLQISVNYFLRQTLYGRLAGLHTVFAMSKFSFVAGHSLTRLKPKYPHMKNLALPPGYGTSFLGFHFQYQSSR